MFLPVKLLELVVLVEVFGILQSLVFVQEKVVLLGERLEQISSELVLLEAISLVVFSLKLTVLVGSLSLCLMEMIVLSVVAGVGRC